MTACCGRHAGKKFRTSHTANSTVDSITKCQINRDALVVECTRVGLKKCTKQKNFVAVTLYIPFYYDGHFSFAPFLLSHTLLM